MMCGDTLRSLLAGANFNDLKGFMDFAGINFSDFEPGYKNTTRS